MEGKGAGACIVRKPPSGREVDFAKQKTEGAVANVTIDIAKNAEHLYYNARSLPHRLWRSSLPEGAIRRQQATALREGAGIIFYLLISPLVNNSPVL